MRLTAVSIMAGDVEAVRLSLAKSSATDRYLIKTIIGLDADEIIPKFYGFGAITKSKYYDFALRSREIVMRIELNPQYSRNEDPSELRNNLYKMISANRTGALDLHFYSGPSLVATIRGYVVKLEAGHSSKTPEVQLTIKCESPMFRGINPVTFGASDLNTGTPIQIPDSISTAPHGLEFQLTVSAPFTNFLMRNEEDSEWVFEVIPGLIDVDTGFIADDILYFSSDYTDNSLILTRDSVEYSIANKVTIASVWPIVFPGQNEFHLDNTDKFAWDYIKYYPAFWGL